jgi:transcriptional regulator with XRE-family HTH domain
MALNLATLQLALEKSNKTQADLARALGVSRGTVSRWFKGEGEPETVERLKQLATELGTSLAALVGEEDAAVNEKERLLLQAFRRLGDMQSEAAIAMLAAMNRQD